MSEQIEHIKLCQYIKQTYPDVIFLSDMSGINLTMSHSTKNWGKIHQMKQMRSSNGIPDLIVLAPRNGYHGLCIELKKTGEKIYKKDGITLKDAHLQEQWEVLCKLEDCGYYAKFAIGFENAKELVDYYFSSGIKYM